MGTRVHQNDNSVAGRARLQIEIGRAPKKRYSVQTISASKRTDAGRGSANFQRKAMAVRVTANGKANMRIGLSTNFCEDRFLKEWNQIISATILRYADWEISARIAHVSIRIILH